MPKMKRLLAYGIFAAVLAGGPWMLAQGVTNRTDATGSSGAVEQEATDEAPGSGATIYDLFQRGGAMMWPILLCSMVTLAFILERTIVLRQEAVFPSKLMGSITGLVSEGRTEEAVDVAQDDKTPLGHLLHCCLMRADYPGFEMESAMEEAGSRILYDLRRNSTPLGVIADVAPLLGLMGTVIGMIKAFDVVARSGALGRTELLAEGIGEALLTTAFGLLVAVPAVIFYQYFRSKAEGLVRTMEDACLSLLVELRKNRKTP